MIHKANDGDYEKIMRADYIRAYDEERDYESNLR